MSERAHALVLTTTRRRRPRCLTMTTLLYFAGKIRKKWVRVWGVLKAGRLTIYDCEPGGAVMPVAKAAIEMAEVRCALATPQPHTRARAARISRSTVTPAPSWLLRP